jgi:hypothetical protein
MEHDCWVIYKKGAFEPNRGFGYFWNECEAQVAMEMAMEMAEDGQKDALKESSWRVVKAKLLTQDPNEDPSS